jgi:hypothetical protein
VTRRRLLTWSAPVAIAVVVVLVKLWSVVIAGGAVASDFASRDAAALRGDVDTLSVVNVLEPAKASFAAGALAVLDDRLPDADRQFSAALAQTEAARSCPVRVDLELVRETMGDRAVAAAHADTALARYRDALEMVTAAPPGCFAGSSDSDARRRAVLDSTAARLNDKINALAPPLPPPQQAGPRPPPPPPPRTTTAPDPQRDPADRRRLDPGVGDPLDRLRQILRDAAPAASSGG